MQEETVNEMLEKELPSLVSKQEHEEEHQRDSSISLLKKCLIQTDSLNKHLDKEKTRQGEYQNSIFEMFRDIVARAQKELDEEKTQRTSSHKNLFLLIENAFKKVNQFHGSRG